jgi:calcineurin-like phosphoesterase family protein
MHERCATEFRGFSSSQEHDETIIDNWNSVVSPADTVIHCGDLTLKKPEFVRDLVMRLNGAIHFIWGNHDVGSPTHREGYKFQNYYTDLWGLNLDTAQAFMRKKLDGRQVLISHYPYSGDHPELDDRYTQYRLRNEGLPLIHGHTHVKEKISYGTMTLQIHVGLDAWDMKPIDQEQIIEILRENI